MSMFIFSVFTWLMMPAAAPSHLSNPVSGQSQPELAITASQTVVVNITAPGTVLVDWSLSNPDGYYEYTVSVYDLTLGQPVTSVITTNLSVSIGNLTSGHAYRFKVEAPSIIIGTGDADMG